MTNDPVVAISHLTHAFGHRTVLDNINLDVHAGQSVAITGRSGSGKSTLLNCILGLTRPHKGTVLVAGKNMTRLSRRQRALTRAHHIGVVFQHGELIEHMSALENVALPLLLAAKDPSAIHAAQQLLDELDVPADTLARDLSGGETGRTALARALVGQPSLILADEPTGSLDTELRDVAADLLFRVARDRGCALIVVTHDPTLAARADNHLMLTDTHLTPGPESDTP